MNTLGLLRLELVAGALIMAAAAVALPLGIALIDVALLLNPYLLGFVFIVMLAFCAVGYFCFIHPYALYRRMPEVLAETDGEYLYIHAKKEARIPLAEISDATVRFELPFILQKGFLRELMIHLCSEEYGDVILETEGHGTYKMRFVSYAQRTANELASFIYAATNDMIE